MEPHPTLAPPKTHPPLPAKRSKAHHCTHRAQGLLANTLAALVGQFEGGVSLGVGGVPSEPLPHTHRPQNTPSTAR